MLSEPPEETSIAVVPRDSHISNPDLSIGLPIFNGACFVREAVESVLQQDCDFELIISDNGSTDETENICRNYAARDGRIKYYRYDENKGAAWNYNNCLYLSTGKYFKWIAHDDKLAPDFCKKCLALLSSDPDAVLVYTRAIIIDGEGEFVRFDSDRLDLTETQPSARFTKYFRAYEGHNICNPVFGIFRSDVLRRTRLIGNFITSDRILLGEIALNGRIREVPEALFYYRWHENNSTHGYNTAERLLWFDPSNKGKLCLVYWKWFLNWSDSITQTAMPAVERLRCRAQLASWALQNGRTLLKELVKGVLWPVLRRTAYRTRDTGL